MNFPQYRKRFDNKSFYMVINEKEMEEVQFVGTKKFIYKLNAEKYFEILLIQSLLTCEDELYSEITEENYLSVKNTP